MAIILAILLILVVYFLHQNRALKTALNTNTQLVDKYSANIAMVDVIYEQPDNVMDKQRDGETMDYEDLEKNDATYTALDRTRKDDDDHFYAHLNEMPKNETGI